MNTIGGVGNEESSHGFVQRRKEADRMKRDLELAAKVQQAILPVNPFELERVSCTYRFLPHDELGGDFLNIVPVSERHLSFYVVDVSSHGAPAGLIAVAISHAISMEARIHNLSSEKYSHFSASEVVASLSKQFQLDDLKHFFTMVYGVLNLDSLVLRYVSAGHPDMIHLTTGKHPVRLKSTAGLGGISIDDSFEEGETQLKQGDRLFVCSDGVFEAMNTKKEQLGFDRAIDFLHKRNGEPLDESVDALLGFVKDWCQPNRPDDDVTILALDIGPVVSFNSRN